MIGAVRGQIRGRRMDRGIFLSLAGTDGFVELPPGPNTYPKGFVTSVYRW